MTLGAMIVFEEVTGKSLLRGLDMEKLSSKDLRALVWACLRHEDKELKLESLDDMIDVADLPMILEKVTEAWQKAVPGVSDPLAENPDNLSTG
jgi:hypothetical protein